MSGFQVTLCQPAENRLSSFDLQFIYTIFERAEISSLFALVADLVCILKSEFSNVQNDDLLVWNTKDSCWLNCKSMIWFKDNTKVNDN